MSRFVAALLLALSLPAAGKAPKLTVFITVDALSTDALLRMRPRLKGGLHRLLVEGAYFPTLRYESAECVTAVGHATLATGTYPWRHGIVSNKVFNRTSGKIEPVFADPAHPVLEAPLGSDDASPVSLVAETVSDRLRQATWMRGKSIAIAGKARSAIALSGKLGEAYWFNEQVGRVVTGTFYKKEAPRWLKAFNDRKLPESFSAKRWELSANAKDYLGDDDRPVESDWYGMGRTFPHPLSGGVAGPGPQSFSALASSPMFNEFTVELAKAVIDGEQLGRDDFPDLLQVSFSAFDRTYHLYGPNSWETQDMLLRLDKSVGDLLAVADRAAGGKALVLLSADHGGAAIPEEWAAQGLDGVRVDPRTLQKGLNDELQGKFKVTNAVAAIDEVDVYLDHKVLADKKLDVAAVGRAAAQWLAGQPEVMVAVWRDDLEGRETAGLLRSLKLGYFPGRSGDVLMVLKPHRVLETEPRGTSHATPWSYDAHVPLLMSGRGVRPGVYPGHARAIDVASTLSALLELAEPAMAEGRALSEALALPK